MAFLASNACWVPEVVGTAGGAPDAARNEVNDLTVDGDDLAATARANRPHLARLAHTVSRAPVKRTVATVEGTPRCLPTLDPRTGDQAHHSRESFLSSATSMLTSGPSAPSWPRSTTSNKANPQASMKARNSPQLAAP